MKIEEWIILIIGLVIVITITSRVWVHIANINLEIQCITINEEAKIFYDDCYKKTKQIVNCRKAAYGICEKLMETK